MGAAYASINSPELRPGIDVSGHEEIVSPMTRDLTGERNENSRHQGPGAGCDSRDGNLQRGALARSVTAADSSVTFAASGPAGARLQLGGELGQRGLALRA
jgi:hypothetical protein